MSLPGGIEIPVLDNDPVQNPNTDRLFVYSVADELRIKDDTGTVTSVTGGNASQVGKVVARQFFTNIVSYNNQVPTFMNVYTYNTPSLSIGTYDVEWTITYEPAVTNSNDHFKIAEGTTDFPTQVDHEDEGKDGGNDIKKPTTIVGELIVSAAGSKVINLRGANESAGTTTVKAGYCKITRIS